MARRRKRTRTNKRKREERQQVKPLEEVENCSNGECEGKKLLSQTDEQAFHAVDELPFSDIQIKVEDVKSLRDMNGLIDSAFKDFFEEEKEEGEFDNDVTIKEELEDADYAHQRKSRRNAARKALLKISKAVNEYDTTEDSEVQSEENAKAKSNITTTISTLNNFTTPLKIECKPKLEPNIVESVNYNSKYTTNSLIYRTDNTIDLMMECDEELLTQTQQEAYINAKQVYDNVLKRITSLKVASGKITYYEPENVITELKDFNDGLNMDSVTSTSNLTSVENSDSLVSDENNMEELTTCDNNPAISPVPSVAMSNCDGEDVPEENSVNPIVTSVTSLSNESANANQIPVIGPVQLVQTFPQPTIYHTMPPRVPVTSPLLLPGNVINSNVVIEPKTNNLPASLPFNYICRIQNSTIIGKTIQILKVANLPPQNLPTTSVSNLPANVVNSQKLSGLLPKDKTEEQEFENLVKEYYSEGKPNENLLKQECKGNFQFKCLICKEIVENNIKVMEHINAHIKQPKLKNSTGDVMRCKYCYSCFSTLPILQFHLDTVHLKKNGISCRICNKDFIEVRELSAHLKRVHSKPEMPYVCQLCEYRSSFHYAVIEHFRTIHSGTDKIQCYICLKVFSILFSNTGLGFVHNYFYHMHRHHFKFATKKCRCCCLIFLSVQELKEHKLKEHRNLSEEDALLTSVREKSACLPVSKKSARRISNRIPSISVKEHQTKTFPPKKSKLIEKLAFTVNNPEQLNSYKCYECGRPMTDEHFRNQFLSCGSCPYSTFCCKAFVDHMIEKHSKLKKTLGRTLKPVILHYPMACNCGYSSYVGNLIAKHLVICKSKTCHMTKSKSPLKMWNSYPTVKLTSKITKKLFKLEIEKATNTDNLVENVEVDDKIPNVTDVVVDNAEEEEDEHSNHSSVQCSFKEDFDQISSALEISFGDDDELALNTSSENIAQYMSFTDQEKEFQTEMEIDCSGS